MTTRPQHARGARRTGVHRRGRGVHLPAVRLVRAASVLATGGLTAGLLLPALGAEPPAGGPAPVAASQSAPAPRAAATPAPAPAPDRSLPAPGPVDPAGDGVAVPDLLAGLPTAAPTTAAPLTPPAPAGLDLSLQRTDDPASPWVVVNKALPLVPADWAPADLVPVGGYEVRTAVQEPLSAMLAAAAADGVRLELRSGFRSREYQEQVHADWAARLGQVRADEVSARPGHSEHQTGLAVDVGSGTDPACDFQACFDQTPEGRWVAARAAEFGFLLRYTAANQAVTGYAPEGWHLRWVGTDVLAEMQRRGVTTLEELFGLPGGPAYR